jgi:hypothetical protein
MILIPYKFEVIKINSSLLVTVTLAFKFDCTHIKHSKLIQNIIFCHVRGSPRIMLQVQN